MILSIPKVHLHVQVILDHIHHTAVFTIAVYFSYHKSGIVVVQEDFVERTKVFFMLSGFDGNQTLVLNSPIN
jgi:cytochrome b